LVTGEFTVSGLAVRTMMFPELVTETPVVAPIEPIIRAPELAMKMPPVELVAASVIPLVAVLTGESAVPMPVDAVISSVEAVIEPDACVILPPGAESVTGWFVAVILVIARLPEPVDVTVVVPPAENAPDWDTLPPEVTVIEPVAVTLPLKVTLAVAS